jgi:hypothetical protein
MKRLITLAVLAISLLAANTLSAIDIPYPTCFPCPTDN